MGDPQNGWFIRENPSYKWMMTGGTPILGNPHMGKYAGNLGRDIESYIYIFLALVQPCS